MNNNSTNLITDSVEQAHLEIWKRFVNKEDGILFDYAGLNGEVVIPTKEECEQGKPNAMAWCTPIEDGPYYNGFYLDGLCNRWKSVRTEEAAREADLIAAGLMRLARASDNYGFIPRGFASDGKTYYEVSSEDQIFPWIYGMWRYIKSGIPTPEIKKEIIEIMEKIVLALEAHGWRIPCHSPAYGYRGNFIRSRVEDISRLLFIIRAMYDLTDNRHWKELYDSKTKQSDYQNFYSTYPDICAKGIQYTPYDGKMIFFPFTPDVYRCVAFEPYEDKRVDGALPFFTTSMAQAALKGLVEMEQDSEVRAKYQMGLDISAERAATHIQRFRDYQNDNDLKFEYDWRFMNDSWMPQSNIMDTHHLGNRQLAVWYEGSPRSPYENNYMREPLFAAWVVVLSGNEKLIAKMKNELGEALTHYQWEKLYTSMFFMAECVYYEGLKYGL